MDSNKFLKELLSFKSPLRSFTESFEDEEYEDYYDEEFDDTEEDFLDQEDIKQVSEEDQEDIDLDIKNLNNQYISDDNIKVSKRGSVEKVEAAFNLRLSPKEYKEYKTYLDSIGIEESNTKLSKEAQIKVLDDAESGNKNASIYLYIRYLRLITGVFWKYFVQFVDPYHKNLQDVMNFETATSISSIAFEILNGSQKAKYSPFKSFNRAVFNENTDLVKQFSYYFYRYLQSKVIQFAKRFERAGLGGNLDSNDTRKVVSLEDRLEANKHNEIYVDSHEDNVDAKILIDNFSEYLDTFKNKKLKQVFDMRSQGMTSKNISKELNITPQHADSLFARVRKLFKKYYNLDN